MKQHIIISFAIACAVASHAAASEPLPRPAPPKAEVRGAAGNQIVYYWQFVRDARGHSAYSDPVIVSNAPNVWSEQNTVVLTPSPVTNATEYGILTTRIETPRELKVEIGAKGDKTFYYWTQTRNGRTVWSPVAGPVKVDGCADKPENKLTWSPTGAEFYYLYRTETPAMPMGWRNCVILTAKTAKEESSWSDKGLSPDSRIIRPAGTASQKPEGTGRYLVGTSKGEAIVDQGQELQTALIYDLNTTDPANRAFKPEIKAFEPTTGDPAAFVLHSENRMVTPQYSWDLVNGIGILQRNIAGGLNSYQYEPGVHFETAKNTYNGIDIHQFNYTAGQKSPYLAFMYNYGVGDNVMFHGAINQEGQNRDAGDEGSEFFSLHMTRSLRVNHLKVAADARPGDLHLRTEGDLGQIAAGRGIVNLSQAYRAGSAHVAAGAIAVGTNTQWTSEMEGWFISFDADTVTANGSPVRQWYRVREYLGPTKLRLLGYTYFRQDQYQGQARTNSPYLLCPYTEMADGDAVANEGLRVAPLQCAWKKGDEIEVIAGPHTTMGLGWMEIGGDFLPQDFVHGLNLVYNGRNQNHSSGASVAAYGWGAGLACHNTGSGIELYNAKVGMQAYKDTPVLISCIRDDPYRFQLSQDANGFVIEDYANRRWVSLGADGITLYGKGTMKGNERTRGASKFSGDGQATQFKIQFTDAYAAKPFVVASANLPIGMGVTETTKEGCTVTFASPPAAGKDNIEVTWMVQE
jgi:hypothetical protein